MENNNDPKEYHIFNYDGSEYKTLLNKKFAMRKPYEPVNHNKLIAFIPGTIIDVFVKEKQKVKKGEKLLILQAMKMNNIIISPINGHVKKLNVKKGDVVPKSHLLIEVK
jgi:biotin carboxyl carrier protein